jgi:hypothetical protein
VVALSGVVKHHIQNDFNARLVQGFDHVAKLIDWPQGIFTGTVGPVGGKKARVL